MIESSKILLDAIPKIEAIADPEIKKQFLNTVMDYLKKEEVSLSESIAFKVQEIVLSNNIMEVANRVERQTWENGVLQGYIETASLHNQAPNLAEQHPASPEPVEAAAIAQNTDLEGFSPLSDIMSPNDPVWFQDSAPSSPLDQFEIFPLLPIQIGDFFVSFTNSSLFMLLTLGLVLLLILLVTKKGGGKLVPNAWQSVVELIYDFVLNLVNEQIGGSSANVKQQFFPCILVTFTFLLFCNLQGMIPFSFTVTSHFLITLALSFSLFIGITIVGFQRHGLHFLSFLLPAGVPLPLAPFLVLLELISHCFRALSSGIRLFANASVKV